EKQKIYLYILYFFIFLLQYLRRITPVQFATCIGLTWTSQNRPFSVNQITKNIELISTDNDVQVDKGMPLQLLSPKVGENNKPLVVMLSWLMAKKKHILKYANFYMDQGFDVLSVSITPWQLLWPVKGTQVIGGYLWAEVMVKMSYEQHRYQPVIDRIVGHIWDSAVDVREIPVGFPRAVFPKNAVLQATVEKYIRTLKYSLCTTYVKCWDKSPHVGHFRKYPKEYITELYAFLDGLGLVPYPEKIQAKL
ncbi:hypothetical protein C0J52_05608, partial [Blattella germanica]